MSGFNRSITGIGAVDQQIKVEWPLTGPCNLTCYQQLVFALPPYLHVAKEGLTSDQVEALADWRGSKLFNAQQRALLAYTDAMTRDIEVPDDVFNDARKHFSERQMVELTMLIGAYNMLTRFIKALKVDPEPPASAT